MDASKHVLVISHDVVGVQMAGPGIRYYHLARVLAREFPTILAVLVGDIIELGVYVHAVAPHDDAH